ncbi:hypothetical protein GQ53DRAFT_770818 [Thozetella sp. PMI_491]|nr:hypothetical protein GQ53DRAFT_770818 [Thozetella sp. PMI_491]
MMREPRRRSPESSRRRRAERRTSREQLAAAAAMPSQTSLRSRADSTTSGSSSTSSSLLNISRKSRRFGLRSFFTSPKKTRRSSKQRFRHKNGSSSSVDSDLAYGQGYISKDSLDRRQRSRGEPEGSQSHHQHQPPEEPLFGPDGRPVLHRAQTDEEILELGRKLQAYAKAENRRDLERAGRPRPSQFATAAAAIGKLSRHNTLESNRGIGSSKPHDENSDDGDWESASEDGSSDDGLNYGGAHFSTQHLPLQNAPPPAVVSQRPPEAIRPPHRKSSAVDPAMFGPVNSLRGLINTPCGFRPGEYRPGEYNRPGPGQRVEDPIPHPSSASIEARPMRTVYAAPTSDPTRFEAVPGSVVSSHQDTSGFPRPAPIPIQPSVPIQAPKPRVPVSTRVLEEKRMEEEARDSRSSRRKSEGKGFAEAAVAGVAAAAMGAAGAAILSDRKDKDKRDRDDRRDRERERERERDRERQREERERSLRELEKKETEKKELERQRERDEKRELERKDPDRMDRRSSKRDSVKIIDDRDGKRDEKREDRKEEKRSELRPNDRKPTREERRAARAETQRLLREVQAQIAQERERAQQKDQGSSANASQPVDDAVGQRRTYEAVASSSSSQVPIDPFQFQVPDDAFQTPVYATPRRPLTPSVTTVEREPNFSRLESDPHPMERLSRRDSYEYELKHAKALAEETQHSTIAAHPENIAVAIAAVQEQDRVRERSRVRAKEPVRDSVQEAADAVYRESRLAKRLEEDQIRSRSASPNPSEQDDEPVVRIVTPPEMDRRHAKSRYDGPNADVRIDNIIVPRDLVKYKAPASLGERTVPIFKSRDPSCERERPLLNLVLPTPIPTPSPEKQRAKEDKKTDKEDGNESEPKPKKQVVINSKGDVVAQPAETDATTRQAGASRNEEQSEEPRSLPHDEPEVRPVSTKKKGKKSSGVWSILAAAAAASAAAAATTSSDKDGSRKPSEEKQETQEEVKRREPSAAESHDRDSAPTFTSLVNDLDDMPPKIGPKPSSPRSSQLPGAFADDLDFTATVAAGLQGTGFDPNIVIDDPAFRRRDSPPGSNEGFYKQPSAETVTDLGIINQEHSQSGDKELVLDDFETPTKPSKKDRKKEKKASKRQSIGLGDIDAPEVLPEIVDIPKGNDFEPLKRDTPEKPLAFDENISVRPLEETELPKPGDVVEDEWAEPKLSKKEQKKRDRAKARALEEEQEVASPRDSQPVEPIEASDDEFQPKLSKKEQKKREKEAAKAAALAESIVEPVTGEPQPAAVADAGEDEWAITPKLSKKEQKKREKAARAEQLAKEDDDLTRDQPEQLDEFVDANEEWNDTPSSKKKSKKSKKSPPAWEDAQETPAEEGEISVPVDAFDDLKAGNDEWDQPKKSKKDKKNRRKSTKDDYDPPDPDDPPDRARDPYQPFDRDVSSVVSDPTRYDDRYESKSNGSRADPEDDMKSVASVPTTSEDLKKKEKRGSGFFGMFGRGTNGTTDETAENQSKNVNAGTLGAGVGLMGAAAVIASQLSHLKATQVPEEEPSKTIVDAPGPPSRPRSTSQDSHTVDPEIVERTIKPAIDPQYGDLLPLPPSVPGSPKIEQDLPALPDSPQLSQDEPSAAATTDGPDQSGRLRSVSTGSQIVDPEIVERAIKPAIDPQYGDLLPLPPSEPGSPQFERDPELPPLPDSRPDTPPEEREGLRIRSQTQGHLRRRSAFDTPAKSPSHTAIPLQLRFGSSPGGLLRSSPLPSPVTPSNTEFGSTGKKLPRPTSWDSSREIKPLLLLDKASSGSLGSEYRRLQGRTDSLGSDTDSPSGRVGLGIVPSLTDTTRKVRAYTTGSSPERSPSPLSRTFDKKEVVEVADQGQSALLAAAGVASAGLVAAALLHDDQHTGEVDFVSKTILPLSEKGKDLEIVEPPINSPSASEPAMLPSSGHDVPSEEFDFVPAKKGKKGKKSQRKSQPPDWDLESEATTLVEAEGSSIVLAPAEDTVLPVQEKDAFETRGSKGGKKKKKGQTWEPELDPEPITKDDVLEDFPATKNQPQEPSPVVPEPGVSSQYDEPPSSLERPITTKKGKKKKGKKALAWEDVEETITSSLSSLEQPLHYTEATSSALDTGAYTRDVGLNDLNPEIPQPVHTSTSEAGLEPVLAPAERSLDTLASGTEPVVLEPAPQTPPLEPSQPEEDTFYTPEKGEDKSAFVLEPRPVDLPKDTPEDWFPPAKKGKKNNKKADNSWDVVETSDKDAQGAVDLEALQEASGGPSEPAGAAPEAFSGPSERQSGGLELDTETPVERVGHEEVPPAPPKPEQAPEPPSSTSMGFFPAAFAVGAAAVGSFLGRSKRDSAKSSRDVSPGSPGQESEKRDADKLVEFPAAPSQPPVGPGLDGPSREPDQDPLGLQGSSSQDKSVGDTTGAGLDTAVSVPNTAQQLPTSDINVSKVSTNVGPREIGELGELAQQDDQNERLGPTQSQPLVEEPSSFAQEPDQPGPLDAADQTPAEPMDWDSTPGKKKGKKGKKKQRGTQDAWPEDEPVQSAEVEIPLDATSLPGPSAASEPLGEVDPSAKEGLEDPAEDLWSQPTGKKGKKDKKKRRQATQDAFEEPPSEEPISHQPRDFNDDDGEVAAVVDDDVDSGIKAASQPQSQGDSADKALVEGPIDDLWDDPSFGKKKKKDKKKKRQSTFDFDDVPTAPETPTIPESPGVAPNPNAEPVTEPQVTPEAPDAADETSDKAAPEASPDDTWELPSSGKKGKKDKKNRQSVQDIAMSLAMAEPPSSDLKESEWSVGEEAVNTPEPSLDPSLDSASAVHATEVSPDDLWEVPSSGKKGKKGKKGKRSGLQEAGGLPESSVDPMATESGEDHRKGDASAEEQLPSREPPVLSTADESEANIDVLPDVPMEASPSDDLPTTTTGEITLSEPTELADDGDQKLEDPAGTAELLPESDFEFTQPLKKGKKKKKSRSVSISPPRDDLSPTEPSQHNLEDEFAAKTEDFDDWDMPESSKKSKKKRQSVTFADPIAEHMEIPAISELPTPSASQEDLALSDQPEPSPANETRLEETDQVMEDVVEHELAPESTETIQKEPHQKEPRASLAPADLAEDNKPESSRAALATVAGVGAVVAAGILSSDEQDKSGSPNLDNSSQDPMEASRSLPESQPEAQDESREAMSEDDFAWGSKKSKKDKKKKRKGQSQDEAQPLPEPSEQTGATEEPQPTTELENTQHSPGRSLTAEPEVVETEDAAIPLDEPDTFITKKSKKDKKKRKGKSQDDWEPQPEPELIKAEEPSSATLEPGPGLSTESTAIGEELVQEPDPVGEDVKEQPVDDEPEFFPSKKSKKDKKKRKSKAQDDDDWTIHSEQPKFEEESTATTTPLDVETVSHEQPTISSDVTEELEPTTPESRLLSEAVDEPEIVVSKKGKKGKKKKTSAIDWELEETQSLEQTSHVNASLTDAQVDSSNTIPEPTPSPPIEQGDDEFASFMPAKNSKKDKKVKRMSLALDEPAPESLPVEQTEPEDGGVQDSPAHIVENLPDMEPELPPVEVTPSITDAVGIETKNADTIPADSRESSQPLAEDVPTDSSSHKGELGEEGDSDSTSQLAVPTNQLREVPSIASLPGSSELEELLGGVEYITPDPIDEAQIQPGEDMPMLAAEKPESVEPQEVEPASKSTEPEPEFFATKKSKKDKKKKRNSQVQDPWLDESEETSPLPEKNPEIESPAEPEIETQPSAEPSDEFEPLPTKKSKKEKRKAKKAPKSTDDWDMTEPASSQESTLAEDHLRAQERSTLEEHGTTEAGSESMAPLSEAEPAHSPEPEVDLSLGAKSSLEDGAESMPVVSAAIRASLPAGEADPEAPPPVETANEEPIPEEASPEDFFPITTKKSKKDKKKRGTAQGELEQALPAIGESSSPSATEGEATTLVTEEPETMQEETAEELWTAPSKKSNKDKKRKGSKLPESEPTSGSITPFTEEASVPTPETHVEPKSIGPEAVPPSTNLENAESQIIQPEDEWAIPTKKSKKEKKRKGSKVTDTGPSSAATLAEEPTLVVEEPIPAVEEPAPMVEEPSPMVEEPTPLAEEPHSFVRNQDASMEVEIPAPSNSLEEVEPSTLQHTEPEDEWAMPAKKKSKDKKKRKGSKIADSEPASSVSTLDKEPSSLTPDTPTELETAAQSTTFEETGPEILQSAEPEPIQPEDEWAIPTKKSKKDKKRSSSKVSESEPASGQMTPAVEERSTSPHPNSNLAISLGAVAALATVAAVSSSQEDETVDAASKVEEDISEPAWQETQAEDEWSVPIKKSKKDKKQKGSKMIDTEPPSSVATPPVPELAPSPTEPAANAPLDTNTSTNAAREIQVEQPELLEEPKTIPAQEGPLRETVPDHEPEAQAEADWFIPTKKSKKDKKRKGSKAAGSEPTSGSATPAEEQSSIAVMVEDEPRSLGLDNPPADSSQDNQPEIVSEALLEILPEPSQLEASTGATPEPLSGPTFEDFADKKTEAELEDEWALPAKKSKKGKRMVKKTGAESASRVATPQELEEALLEAESQGEPAILKPLEDFPTDSSAREAIAEDFWEAPTKKSKKKGKKLASQPDSGAMTPVAEQLEENVRLVLVEPSQVTDEVTQPVHVVNHDIETIEQEKTDVSRDLTAEEPAIEEIPKEEDESPEFAVKKSKKGKKGKGKRSDSESASGTATPAARDEALSTDVLSAAVLADAAAAGLSALGSETERQETKDQDIASVSRKQSKKDKKRRKGTALVWDDEPPVQAEPVEEDVPAIPDAFSNERSLSTEVLDNPEWDKIEINPALTGSFSQSPDRGFTSTPTIGLGLIANPPVLYPRNEPSPKLLTALETPPPSQPEPEYHGFEEALRSDEPSSRPPSSHVPHEPPFESSGIRKKAKTKEPTDAELDEPVVSSRDVSNSFMEGGLDATPLATDAARGQESANTFLREDSQPIEKELVKLDDKPIRTTRELAAEYLEHHHTSDVHLVGMEGLSGDRPMDIPVHMGVVSPNMGVVSPNRELAASYLDHPHEQSPGKPQGKKARGKEPAVETKSEDKSVAEAAAVAGALTSGVAALAQKFGGSKKKGKKKKSIDKRTQRDDDMFDDVLWEGADRRPLEGSRMDTIQDNFWDVPEGDDAEKGWDEEAGETIKEMGEPTKEATAGEERQETRESGGFDAGSGLERQDSDTIPRQEQGKSKKIKKERQRSRSPSPVQRTFSFPDDIADEDAFATRDVHEPQTILPSIEPADDPPRALRPTPSLDFRRSLSSLPPVKEEGSDEDEEQRRHRRHQRTSHGSSRNPQASPDTNRDSGFVTGSPHMPRGNLHADEAIRDSGVHLREWAESTPKSTPKHRELSRFDSTPARRSTSSVEDEQQPRHHSHEDAKHRDLRRSPAGERSLRDKAVGPVDTAHRLREPSPPPRTPEPEKLAIKKHTKDAPTPSREHQQQTPQQTRSVSDRAADKRAATTPDPHPRRVISNTSLSRLRTPEPLNLRPDSPGSLRSYSGTPPLRRVDKRSVSSDLRSVSLSQRKDEKAGDDKATQPASSSTASALPGVLVAGAAALGAAELISRAAQNNTPVANEGRVRAKDMADVYDGYGEGRIGSPRSPTRPHSMRRRQSMQVLELESRVEQLVAENRMLNDARAHAESAMGQKAAGILAERDGEIDTLKRSLQQMQREVERLTQINEGLSTSTSTIAVQHHERVRQLEAQHAEAMRAVQTEHQDATRELESLRGTPAHHATLEEKDAEIAELRAQLEAANTRIRSMQEQILAANPAGNSDFLTIKDVDHFDTRCQQLCSHVQQWVLRFSKFSDMRACRKISEINDEKVVDRLDNAVLDGSDVDVYLRDRVRRRDIFMSMTMTMIWEFVFTRYLFGMDREQRQKLKTLEKQLLEVGPPAAVRQWRAVTLTLLSRRSQFRDQRHKDTEAVVQAVLGVLVKILPPPSNLEDQIQAQLRRVMREAVDLAIEMRTQRAEYMMLPPLQPEYDDTGELIETVTFNPALMHERSGDSSLTNDELADSTVRVVLFPLVVKKGDDAGRGDEEVVVWPAQVLVARLHSSGRRSARMVTPSSDAGGASLFTRSVGGNGSNVTMSAAGGADFTDDAI